MRNANDNGLLDGLRCGSLWPTVQGWTTGGAEIGSHGRRILIHLSGYSKPVYLLSRLILSHCHINGVPLLY